ncbi:MAG: iron-containing alcohol dehydrogenase [Chloroflexi bacterium]|nr:iron-containing alcohol dehydrogenase [Chloroflexota bacterium]
MSLPVPVEFGAGCVQKLGQYLGNARKALLVTGRRAMRSAGVTDRILNLLVAAEVEGQVFDGISSEPNYDEVEAAAELARQFGAEVIIGCGGGSALDAAKAVAVAATHPGPIMDYVLNGPRTITAATLPIIAISGTSGTGSHVGRVSVLSDRSRGLKRALISDYLYPRAAFCDAEVLRTMPPEVTAVTGFDAFAQALEGCLSRADNPMGKLCAQEVLRIISRALPQAIRNGDDLDLRNQMAWGDTLAGISLATNAIITPHSFSMVLGGRHGITHARSIASVMPACLENSRPNAIGKLAQVARLLGCGEPLSDEELADWAIAAIERFIVEIGLGHPVTDYGVAEADFPAIAFETRMVFGLRVDADPVPQDAAGLERILHRSVARWEELEASDGNEKAEKVRQT